MERNPESKHSSQQELRACDICGALLNISDSAPRLADHFIGKMHVGYKTIRETLESLEESVRHKRVRIRSRSRSPYKERHVSRSENQAWSRNSARSESQHWGRNSHRDDNAGWSRSSFRRESRDFREPHSYSHDRRDSRSSRYRH